MDYLTNGNVDGKSPRITSRQSRPSRRNPVTVRAIIGEGESARETTLTRRPAWMLHRLALAGQRGFAASDAPAGCRVSHFVWQLRHEHGIPIDVVTERNSGKFGGSHARYCLATPVRIVSIEGE